MSVLSTNCHGIGGVATFREIRVLVKRYASSILCVVETHMHKISVENLSHSLGFDKSFAISSSS
jgi:hypothetical protein